MFIRLAFQRNNFSKKAYLQHGAAPAKNMNYMKTARSTQKTSQLYRGSTFLQYHKDIPGESNPAGAKTALGGVHK